MLSLQARARLGLGVCYAAVPPTHNGNAPRNPAQRHARQDGSAVQANFVHRIDRGGKDLLPRNVETTFFATKEDLMAAYHRFWDAPFPRSELQNPAFEENQQAVAGAASGTATPVRGPSCRLKLSDSDREGYWVLDAGPVLSASDPQDEDFQSCLWMLDQLVQQQCSLVMSPYCLVELTTMACSRGGGGVAGGANERRMLKAITDGRVQLEQSRPADVFERTVQLRKQYVGLPLMLGGASVIATAEFYGTCNVVTLDEVNLRAVVSKLGPLKLWPLEAMV